GGEEFLVVMSNTSSEAAAMVGERLRRAVMELQCLAQGRAIELSVSLGCATLLPGESIRSIMHRADSAMYAAKNDGRNRLVVAS
ncbi:MAG: GGDEF domain-containing protein, partial [Pseudomonas sp.]|nr:GGDEF domain-containing protein [Pseudomonas sp.]